MLRLRGSLRRSLRQCLQKRLRKRLLFTAALWLATQVGAAGSATVSATVSATTTATSLEGLLESDQLRLRSWLQPEADIVVGEEVRLTIEVATRRWFAGGTRIRPPEVRVERLLDTRGIPSPL